MSQRSIPYILMRGGTSKGAYFLRSDLPKNTDALAELLANVIGAGHPLNIDGIGGGSPITTKVAMLSKSDDDWADIDYFFAQVGVENRRVDFNPTCGNILVGVGPAALEMHLLPTHSKQTTVNIRATNTGARVTATILTDAEGAVTYDGDVAIDGVPNTAAPIKPQFRDVVGGLTGKMFPTGKTIEKVNGDIVTCIDVTVPMVIGRARDFGLSGNETAAALNDNKTLFARIENIRVKAGEKMGLGDVSGSVVPKFGLIESPRQDGHALVRYFTPTICHPSLAVTGSQCLASCLLSHNTVAEGIAQFPDRGPLTIKLEHPMGLLDVLVDYNRTKDTLDVFSVGMVRTARKIAAGHVFIAH